MAAPQFNKYKPMTTPKGIAVFPWLTKPDTKFNEDGVYHCGIALNPEDPGVNEFLARVKEITKEAAEAVKASGVKKVNVHPPVVEEEDDDGNKTGMFVIKTKSNATRKGKNGRVSQVQLTLVDAKRNPHPGNIPVYGGSILKLSVTPVARFVQNKLYVTFYINAVQVIELQTSNGVNGFFEEEDGYEAEGNAESAFADESETTSDDADEDDDDLY